MSMYLEAGFCHDCPRLIAEIEKLQKFQKEHPCTCGGVPPECDSCEAWFRMRGLERLLETEG
jgi:hypothetical protein